jgi:hypothetical protein
MPYKAIRASPDEVNHKSRGLGLRSSKSRVRASGGFLRDALDGVGEALRPVPRDVQENGFLL